MLRVLSNDDLRRYTSYIDATPSQPRQFVADKFDRYDVVLLGEMHWKKQDVDFVNQLIPYLYRTKGIRIFAWEFGAAELQGEADALVDAPACLLYPRLLAPAVFGEQLTYLYPFRGAIEQIYRDHKKPFAVDTKASVFGDLKDDQSYYSMDRWGALTLREMCDGYIVLSSIDDMEPVGLVPDWVTDRADLEEVKSLLVPEDAARIGDVPALLAYIERQAYRSQIKQIRNLGK